MLKLTMETFQNGSSCPVSVKIADNYYYFHKGDELFSHLQYFINYKLEVTYSGFRNTVIEYDIKKVYKENGKFTLELN